MNIAANTIRLLGIAQLFVFGASLLSEQLQKSVLGTGSISEMLVNTAKKSNLIWISSLIALFNCLGIIILGVLFFVVLNGQNRIIALVALGCFVVEAITLAVSKIGTYGLIPLSQDFVSAGAPDSTYHLSLGEFMYNSVDRKGYDIHMLFFCIGAFLWYYLLYLSSIVPPFLSIWGMIAISLLTIPVLIALLGREFLPATILALPYAPYELVLGIWLIVISFK